MSRPSSRSSNPSFETLACPDMRGRCSLATPDLQPPLAPPQRLRLLNSNGSLSTGCSFADVWAQRHRAAAVAHAQSQGYSLDVREDLAAFRGPPRDESSGLVEDQRPSNRDYLWKKQTDRSHSHQHASSSGRQPAPGAAKRSVSSRAPAAKPSVPTRSPAEAGRATPAGNSKRELFRRSAATARGPKRPQPEAEPLDLHAELKSLLREMDDLDFADEGEDLAEDSVPSQPQQQGRQSADHRPAAVPIGSSFPGPVSAELQTSQPPRLERIQLQASPQQPDKALEGTTSMSQALLTEGQQVQLSPAAEPDEENFSPPQVDSPPEVRTAEDKWDAFWDDSKDPTRPASRSASLQAAVQQGAAAASSSDRLPRPAYDQPRYSTEELQEKPSKQRQPRAAKPRPGSEIPSFIVVSQAPAESLPQQAPAAVPHTGRQASARTSQDLVEPRGPWQNSLLQQPAQPGPKGSAPLPSPVQPSEPSQDVPPSAVISSPNIAPRASDPGVQTQPSAQAAGADGHQLPEGAGQRVHTNTEREASQPKVRQLRPRSTARAAAQQGLEAPSEDALARVGLSTVPSAAASALDRAQVEQYEDEDDEEYFDEDLDSDAFWEGRESTRVAKGIKKGLREVPAGSELDFFAASSFKGLGASEEMQAALQGLGIQTPSHVQAAAFKAMLFGSTSLLVADHAGSGKTLAYLAPLIQRLRQQEASDKDFAPDTRDAPRALVLTPTAELCQQVLSVARGLARAAPVRSCAITGDRKWAPQKQALKGGLDLVVGTPGRVLSHVQAGTINLQHCHTVVIDEVDVLLGDQHAFSAQTRALQQAVQPGTRFVLVTATLPEPVWLDMQAIFPDIRMAKGPRLHMRPPTLTERVVDCSGGDEISEESGFQRKAEALLGLLGQEKSARTLIFCNKIPTCRKVENFLNRNPAATGSQEQPLTVLPCHAAIEDSTRAANLKAFLAAPAQAPLALVCTDRASRGLDSSCCSHVVLFDFPRDPSEYMRRAGRTARGASQGGLVSILVLGRQLKLAHQIVRRNARELPIHKLPTLPE